MKRETILKATAVFQRYMPCQQLPEIHQVTVNELEKKRSELVERLQSSQDMYDAETDDSLMEFIHGEKGDAIIIKKDYFSIADEEGFANALWHELGHFVATKAESPELRKFLEENNEELDIAYGYWFWSEFIAEAISCHVSNEYRKTRPNYHPEKAFCNLDSKLEVSNQISMMLNTIFRGPQIDIFSLSFYYAHFLKEDLYELYRKALTGCTLEDTAGIMFFPYNINEMMLNLMDKLGNQLRKENFWIVSAEWIEELGDMVMALDIYHMKWMMKSVI